MRVKEGIKKARNPAVNIFFKIYARVANIPLGDHRTDNVAARHMLCCEEGVRAMLVKGRSQSDKAWAAAGQPTNRAVRVNPEVKDSNFLKDTIKVLLASPL